MLYQICVCILYCFCKINDDDDNDDDDVATTTKSTTIRMMIQRKALITLEGYVTIRLHVINFHSTLMIISSLVRNVIRVSTETVARVKQKLLPKLTESYMERDFHVLET